MSHLAVIVIDAITVKKRNIAINFGYLYKENPTAVKLSKERLVV